MSTFFTGCNIRGKLPPGLDFIEKFDTIQPSFIAFAMTAVGLLNLPNLTPLILLNIQILCALDAKIKKTTFKSEVYGPKYLKHLEAVEAWKREFPLHWASLEKEIKEGLW